MKNITRYGKFIFSVFAVMLISVVMAMPTYAAADKVIDDAKIFKDSEIKSINKKISSFLEISNLDFIIVTTTECGDTMSGTEKYADDLYKTNGYGLGEDKSGLIVVIGFGKNNNTVVIRSKGDAKTSFTDYGCTYICEEIASYLHDKEYKKACDKMLSLSEEFYNEAKDNKPYDVNHKYKSTADKMKVVAISFGVGLVIALITVFVMKGKMNTVHTATRASGYIVKDSRHITNRQDIFLHKTVTKTKKASSSDSSSSGGGSSHGGGGAHF